MKNSDTMDKKADLAGPGIGNYEDLEKVLPRDYRSLLDPKETQRAIRLLKLWRVRNGLRIKHFALELLAIKLLKGRRSNTRARIPASESASATWLPRKPLPPSTSARLRLMRSPFWPAGPRAGSAPPLPP